MSFKRVEWNIRGTKPLMLNNPAGSLPGATAESTTRTPVTTAKPAFEEAKSKLYASNGHLYVPAQMLWKAMVEACPGTKIGKTATSGILPPAVEPAEEELILCHPDSLNLPKPRPLGAKQWLVDTRPISTVVRGKEIMILVSRPKFPEWGLILPLLVERDVIAEKYDVVITQVLNIAGVRGIGSGRLRRPKASSIWVGIRMGKFVAEIRTVE